MLRHTTRLARVMQPARAFAATPKPTNAMRGPIGWGALAVTGAAGCGLAYYYEVEKTRRQELASKKQTTYGKPSLGGPWTLVDAKTNKPLGTNFPVITINDMVNAQYNLLDYFKIEKLFAVAGGSMGGMQVLQFVSNFPNKARVAVPIACTASHSAQNIALNELGRQAIMADPTWNNGSYFKTNLSRKFNS